MKISSQKKQQVVLVILFLTFFFMLIGLNARLSEYFRLTDQYALMQTRISNLKGTQIGLQTQVAYASSEKAIEEWARTYGHMALPGDNVIIPIPFSGTQQPVDLMPPVDNNQADNWEVWWELFFAE